MLVIQHHTSKEEEWADKVLCKFQKSQQSLPKRWIPAAKHGFIDRLYSRKRNVFIHRRVQQVQSDQNGIKGCRENYLQNTHRQFLPYCDAFWVEKHRRNLPTYHDVHIPRHDTPWVGGLCKWHSCEIKTARRSCPNIKESIWKM